MRTAFAVTAFVAAAFAQSSSVDPFPQTTFLQQTNSLGVVTGQPAAATSQPAADSAIPVQPSAATNVGVPASIPAVAPGIYTVPVLGGNVTRSVVVSANNSTTIVLNEPTSGSAASNSAGATATGSGASGSGASGSRTGASGSGASSTASGTGAANSAGAAANLKVAAGSLVGFGAFVAAFL